MLSSKLRRMTALAALLAIFGLGLTGCIMVVHVHGDPDEIEMEEHGEHDEG